MEQREQRPEAKGQEIGHLITKAVEEHAARNLRQRIGPGKGGKDNPHHRRADAKLLSQLRRRDAQNGTVEIVNHGPHCQQRQNTNAPPGARYRVNRLSGSHAILAKWVHSVYLSLSSADECYCYGLSCDTSVPGGSTQCANGTA